jgi:putative DNA primase/helicase
MDFLDFCRAHGIVIDRLPLPGRWVRLPTTDKPRHRNGAVKWMGTYGLCQNWAEQTEPAAWKAAGETRAAAERVRRVVEEAAQHQAQAAKKAAQRAIAILAECELAAHPYLASKGFPEELVNVWNRETENVMVVPMRAGRQIVGAQLIKPDGDKKFLYGQRSGGAEFVFGVRGTHVLCEGYATALSAQQALRNLKAPYVLHTTFSAGNMKKVAEALPAGIVLADNDESGTGERVAREIGWPYWMSDAVGEDANDYARRAGLFALAMGIKRVMPTAARKKEAAYDPP